MGAATATTLYSAACFAIKKYGNGTPYPSYLTAAFGLSGWLPCSKTLNKKFEEASEAARCGARSFPLLLSHGKGDDVVPYKFGEKSSWASSATGFQDVTFKSYTLVNVRMRFEILWKHC